MLSFHLYFAVLRTPVDLEALNWLRSGPHRVPVLRLLARRPMLPSEVARALDINPASVSRILRDLVGKGFATRTGGSARTVTYALTDAGRHALADAEEVT